MPEFASDSSDELRSNGLRRINARSLFDWRAHSHDAKSQLIEREGVGPFAMEDDRTNGTANMVTMVGRLFAHFATTEKVAISRGQSTGRRYGSNIGGPPTSIQMGCWQNQRNSSWKRRTSQSCHDKSEKLNVQEIYRKGGSFTH